MARIFSGSASRDYSRVPTQEPSTDDLSVWPDPHRRHTLGIVEYSSLVKTPEEFKDLPRANVRHTVQFGVLNQLESQVPLTESHKAPSRRRSFLEQFPEKAEEDVLVENPASCLSFVEKSWFQAISAVVIISNVITTIVELDKPQTKNIFFISDQVMLGFYVVELVSRIKYFGVMFFVGPSKFVCWNVLDIVVVVAGVLDQWLMPVLPVGQDEGTVSNVLQLLRLLRLLRVLKIVRVFLDIDLSWTESAAFQSFIGLVILINSLLMGTEIDIPWYGWFYVEQILLVIYVFELSVRLKNFGKYFFSCENADITWNILDFIIVSSSVLDSWITPLCGLITKSISGPPAEGASQKKAENAVSFGKFIILMRMLRLMRILRLAKLVKSVRPLYILVTGVMAALQGVAWVLVLTIVTLYAMGILATSLIGKKMAFPPGVELGDDVLKPFSTVPDSMFTLFRVMSGAASDTEQVAIDNLMDNAPSIKLGFVFFMITSSWTLLSILTAVVSENMISTTGQQEEEHKIANAEEDRMRHVHKLKELFHTIDTRGDGQVQKRDIEDFLSDKSNAVATASGCRVPVRDVREVLQTVAESCEGTTLSLENFVEHLADVSNVVTEKSMMKIEAMLTNMSRAQEAGFKQLNASLKTFQERPNSNAGATLASAVEASSKTLRTEFGTACKGHLEVVERLMQGLAERTEACFGQLQQRNQGLLESMTQALEQALPKVDKFSESLELQFRRMQDELLLSMRSQEPDIPKDREAEEAKRRLRDKVREAFAFSVGSGQLEVALRAAKEADGKQTDVADMAKASGAQLNSSAAEMEVRLLAIEESIHDFQQKTESSFTKNEGLLEKAVHQGLSAHAVDKFSETLEHELRVLRQELVRDLGGRDLEVFKMRDGLQKASALVAIDGTSPGADEERPPQRQQVPYQLPLVHKVNNNSH